MSDYIPAATIVLMRDAPDLEVLMVERHADIAFAGGAMVFPGGRVEKSDDSDKWLEHCDQPKVTEAGMITPRVAAVREAFEETGILLARRNNKWIGAEAAEFDHLRADIEKDDTLFLDLIKREGLRLALDVLQPFARWRPPKEATHKRFDTWFFAAKAPTAQTARPDGGEATEIVWTSPSAVLADKEAGRRKMIFPTTRNVELLGVSKTAEDVLFNAQDRTIRPVVPAVKDIEGEMFLTIPDDLGYPVTQEPLATAFRI